MHASAPLYVAGSRRNGYDTAGEITRRMVVFGASAMALAACTSSRPRLPQLSAVPPAGAVPGRPIDVAAIYARHVDDGHEIPTINHHRLAPRLWRQRVSAPKGSVPGTIMIDLQKTQLLWVDQDGTAISYGVGIGAEGFAWSGRGEIGAMAPWPRWTPPAAMVARFPDLERYWQGMDGGIANPLGARALYIYQGGRDTLYRVHGTAEWWSIGRSMSSGCVRMLNQDVIDLYARVQLGATIIVR